MIERNLEDTIDLDDTLEIEEDQASRHVEWLQQQDLDDEVSEDFYHDELERDHDEPYEPDVDEAQEWHDFDPDC